MKKEKITFAQRTVLLFSVTTMLIFVNVIIWLIMLCRQKTMGLMVRIIFVIMFLSFVTGLVLVLKNWIYRQYLEYTELYKKFNNGQIYREFMDRAGFVFPGMNSVANITEALETFFRYTITDTGIMVTIEDELENVDNYFKIQKYRFGEKLSIIYEFVENDPDICMLLLPKLTLQPIIENAIYHGLERKSEGGEIRIGMELTERNVIIRIKDNGVGIDDKDLATINYGLEHTTMPSFSEESKNKKGGIAINNVCRRIKLLFGEDYSIHVYSLTGVGTEVCIILPVVKKESGLQCS